MESSRKDDRPSSLLKACRESFKTRKPPPPPPPPVAGISHLSPVIVHMHAPKVIHARPQDFMRVVQLLTGKQPPTEAFCPPAGHGYAGGGGGGGPSSSYFASDVNYAPDDASGAHHHYSGDPPRAREFRIILSWRLMLKMNASKEVLESKLILIGSFA